MLIFEIENPESVDTNKLASLVQWLSGIAGDANSKKEISVKTFVELAKNLGINVSPLTINDLIVQKPLSNMLMPIDPANPDVIKYIGNKEPDGQESDEEQINPDDSEKVVAASANSAMKKRFGKKLN
jgi:hypothetical protein